MIDANLWYQSPGQCLLTTRSIFGTERERWKELSMAQLALHVLGSPSFTLDDIPVILGSARPSCSWPTSL